MIYVQIINNETGMRHYQPFHETNGMGKTAEELEQTGILVEALPEAQPQEGQEAVLKYSETDGLYYDYVDRPLTPEEDLAAVQAAMGSVLMESAMDKERIATLETSQSDLLMESAMDKGRIAELEAVQSEMLMEIASLKMGGI